MKTFFISSTFKDMQAERDLIHERIIPRLRTNFRAFGESIQEVDLRWGVDTINMSEEESGHEVLKVCIDAIDRCKPYLIVLLGERYGWIPEKAIVDSAKDFRISNQYEDNMSITELEIQYGALLNEEAFDKCIFCFRNSTVVDKIPPKWKYAYQSESPHHKLRLTALKKQIRAKKDAILIEYDADWNEETQTLCGLEHFEENLYLRLEEMVRQDCIENHAKNLMERQVDEVRMMQQDYLSSYVRRYPEEFLAIKAIGEYDYQKNHISGNPKSDCLLICGDAGSGKSALMAFLADFSTGTDTCNYTHPILCFAGASGCKNEALLKRFIVYQLEEILELEHDENYQSYDDRLRILNVKANGKGIVCFVDGLDQIYHGQTNPYLDLLALCTNIYWVFSALPEFPFDQAAGEYQYETVFVEGLYQSQRTELIANTANRRGKNLGMELSKLITDTKGASNPLFLSLVLQRLFMMNKQEFEEAERMAPGMEGLYRYMQQMLGQIPEQPEEMASYILSFTAQIFSENPLAQNQFHKVLMLIACSHGGLSEKELTEILALEQLSFLPIKFQQIVSYLYDAFIQRNSGKWTFNHRLFEEAIKKSMTEKELTDTKQLLIRYSFQNKSFLQQEGFYYLLEEKNDSFSIVLEQAVNWENKSQIFDLIGNIAKNQKDYRTFFLELAKKKPSDNMAEFWLELDDFIYGSDVEQMAGEIIKTLAVANISSNLKWQLTLRSLFYCTKAEIQELFAQAEKILYHLPEPEVLIAKGAFSIMRASYRGILGIPTDEAEELSEKALEYMEHAISLLGETGEWKSFYKILDYLKTLADDLEYYNSPNTIIILNRILELFSSLKQYEDTNDYTYYKIYCLYHLCAAYTKKQFRDFNKAKEYGDQALALADQAVTMWPTVRNMTNKINAITAYTQNLKLYARHPYFKKAIECAKHNYATTRIERHKRMLARLENQYAESYFYSVIQGFDTYKPEYLADADEIWSHGCQLFEELIANDYNQSETASYGTFLADRAEYMAKLGYLSDAIQYGERSISILTDFKHYIEKKHKDQLDDYNQRMYRQNTDWCIGWLGRIHATLAKTHSYRFNHEEAIIHGEAALKYLLERSAELPRYYATALTMAILLAQEKYRLRKDEDALMACNYVEKLMEDPRALDLKTELLLADLHYIRGRIALCRKDIKTAWDYYKKCEAMEKTQALSDKLLIFKADCLTQQNQPEAPSIWQEALNLWRKNVKQQQDFYDLSGDFRKTYFNKKYGSKFTTRETYNLALTVYYMAYCYHHCVTTNDQLREAYDEKERELLYVIYKLNRGDLAGKLPPMMKIAEQTTHLEGLDAEAAYQTLIDARRKLSQEFTKNQTYMQMFPCQKKLPLFQIYQNWEGDICYLWPEDYETQAYNWWMNLMRRFISVLLLCPNERIAMYNKLDTIYQIISLYHGSEYVDRADISSLETKDLERLLKVFNRKREIGRKGRNIYWYTLKNVWTAELYRRSSDFRYISNRLNDFEEFLTDEMEQHYHSLYPKETNDMKQEVVWAVNHLIEQVAKTNPQGALKIVQWAESIEPLKGTLRLKSMMPVKADNTADQKWLEDKWLSYTKYWLDKVQGRYWTINLL